VPAGATVEPDDDPESLSLVVVVPDELGDPPLDELVDAGLPPSLVDSPPPPPPPSLDAGVLLLRHAVSAQTPTATNPTPTNPTPTRCIGLAKGAPLGP
jgi:hypothetical protein